MFRNLVFILCTGLKPLIVILLWSPGPWAILPTPSLARRLPWSRPRSSSGRRPWSRGRGGTRRRPHGRCARPRSRSPPGDPQSSGSRSKAIPRKTPSHPGGLQNVLKRISVKVLPQNTLSYRVGYISNLKPVEHVFVSADQLKCIQEHIHGYSNAVSSDLCLLLAIFKAHYSRTIGGQQV